MARTRKVKLKMTKQYGGRHEGMEFMAFPDAAEFLVKEEKG